jgi:hypothetical protein
VHSFRARNRQFPAKLDRLARNVYFVSGLTESGVDFIAADNPHANKFMVHLLAAFAEHEREQISQPKMRLPRQKRAESDSAAMVPSALRQHIARGQSSARAQSRPFSRS